MADEVEVKPTDDVHDAAPRGTPRGRARAPSVGPDLDALLVAHCRDAVTELPRGVLGTATAAMFLAALPGACRLQLPDITGTGPAMFSVLVSHGLLAAMPSPRVLPAALALAAGVSPLLERRSARQWTLWLARSREPNSAVAAAVRHRTPGSQIAVAAAPPKARPLRSAALREERDALLAALSQAQADAASSGAELAMLHERVHAGERETEAHKLELDRRIEHVQQRLIEMERILEADAAAQTRDRAELAEIRQQCGIPAGDSRSTVEVIKGIKRAVASLEAAANSSRAELARVLAERDKLAAQLEQTTRELARARSEPFAGARSPEEAERHRRLQPLLGYLNGLEVDLAEATAENELRRSRREQPAPQEVEKARQEAAQMMRQLQAKRAIPIPKA